MLPCIHLSHHELQGSTLLSSLATVVWYGSGSNPSHLEGLGRAGSSGKGEEECSANSGVHSCLQVQWSPNPGNCQVPLTRALAL